MFKEMNNSEMNAFAEGFVPVKNIIKDNAVAESIKPILKRIEAGEALRVEGKETITGADLIANLAVVQFYLDKAPMFSIDAPDRDLTQIVQVRTVPDFKPVKIFTTDEVDQFEEVKQAEDYKATSMSDAYTQIAVKKFGKIMKLSWETLVSDSLGELNDLQAKLIRAGKRTLFKQITDTFAANLSYYTSGNKNLGSGALNETNLTALVQKVAQQKDSKGNPLWIKPKFLVVPTALEVTAKKLVNPFWSIYPTSLDSMGTKFDLTVIADPDLDDVSTTGYYLFTDPADLPAITHLTLAGHNGIELLIKISDQKALLGAMTQELGSFQNDTFEIKARFFANNTTRYTQASAYSPGV